MSAAPRRLATSPPQKPAPDQARPLRNKDDDGVAGQAYDRGANAAKWLWRAQQRMKPAAK